MIYVTLNKPEDQEGLKFKGFKSERYALEYYKKLFEGDRITLNKYRLKVFSKSYNKPTVAQAASLLQGMGLPASGLRILSPWKTRDNNYWVTSKSDIYYLSKTS